VVGISKQLQSVSISSGHGSRHRRVRRKVIGPPKIRLTPAGMRNTIRMEYGVATDYVILKQVVFNPNQTFRKIPMSNSLVSVQPTDLSAASKTTDTITLPRQEVAAAQMWQTEDVLAAQPYPMPEESEEILRGVFEPTLHVCRKVAVLWGL
jgi:hypothetical protein